MILSGYMNFSVIFQDISFSLLDPKTLQTSLYINGSGTRYNYRPRQIFIFIEIQLWAVAIKIVVITRTITMHRAGGREASSARVAGC